LENFFRISMNWQIVHKGRKDIDDDKWNACIAGAPNGLIYSYTFYLDAMASNWDALIVNDYEAVMPLTWRKKWTFAYLYQPFLTAQLGVTGKGISGELVAECLKNIPHRFRFIDIALNYANVFGLSETPFLLRNNYVLNLQADYAVLNANYRQHIKRNIKKATAAGSCIDEELPFASIAALATKYTPGVKNHQPEMERFRQLFESLKAQRKAVCRGVYSTDKNLLAAAVFLFWNNRAYYILAANNPESKRIGASHLLIDSFIKEHAGQNLLLDFEGSDVRGLAFFYASFGAQEEKYPALKLNRLPFYAKWLKRG